MGQPLVIPTDLVVQGNLSAKSQTIAAGAVGDAQVAAAAAIAASKLIHDHRIILAQGSATTAANQTQAVYKVIAAAGATVLAVQAWAITPAGSPDTITIDVKARVGAVSTTILSSVITLNASQAAGQIVSGAITTAALAQDTILEVVITTNHSSGTLPAGVGVAIQVTEATQ